VKHDAIPGMTIPLQTTPVQTGDSELGCAQLCGNSHYRMKGYLHILTQDGFDEWLAEQSS
jgi:cytochrome c oxidase subunit 2